MNERMTSALRGVGVAAALGVMAMAVWFVMRAPAPDAHVRPLAAGGRVVGIDGWPLFADVDGDGDGEVVFWRSPSGTLVAMKAETGDYVWESAPLGGGARGSQAWATRDGLFVATADGGYIALDAKDGRQRFRRELGEKASALCRAKDGLWLTLASGRTLALDARTGSELGARPTPEGAALLRDCDPIWGDRLPDRGPAKIAEPGDWTELLGTPEQVSALGPQPVPEELSASVWAYLPGGGAPSWLLYGERSGDSRAPMLARAGTRAAPLADAWLEPAAAQETGAVQRGPLIAATAAAAFVAFFYDGERLAALARFDLPSGRRRWQVQLTPLSLAAIGASERHVVLTWAGRSLSDGARPQSDFALMVLNAETGEKVSQIGYATHSH